MYGYFCNPLSLINLLKPVFRFRNIRLQFKHAQHQLKTVYSYQKPSLDMIFKDYWCTVHNQLLITLGF